MSRRRRDGGYISVVVLMIGALIATLAITLLQVARPGLERSRLGADDARAEALIDAGVAAAGYLLFAADNDIKSVDGRSIDLGDGEVRLAVRDDGGRVDLNGAKEALLAGLFSAAGGTSMAPAAFAARVADWRDADSDRGQDGGEAGDYSGEGLDYGPRDAPFQSVEELKMLLGLSAEDYDRLVPYITVFNPGGRIDPLAASGLVLSAVPGMDRATVEATIERQKTGSRDQLWFKSLVSAHGDFLTANPIRSYRVGTLARLADGYAEAGEAVITPGADSGRPYRIGFWRTGPAPQPLR